MCPLGLGGHSHCGYVQTVAGGLSRTSKVSLGGYCRLQVDGVVGRCLSASSTLVVVLTEYKPVFARAMLHLCSYCSFHEFHRKTNKSSKGVKGPSKETMMEPGKGPSKFGFTSQLFWKGLLSLRYLFYPSSKEFREMYVVLPTCVFAQGQFELSFSRS